MEDLRDIHDLDGVHLHSIPSACAVLERYGRIEIINTDKAVTPAALLNVAYYAVGNILPPFSFVERYVYNLPVSTFLSARGRVVVVTRDFYRGDVSDPLLPLISVVWTRSRQHAWLEVPDDARSYIPRLWKTEYSVEEYSVNKSYTADFRARGLLPPVPGFPRRALVWKGVRFVDGRYCGVVGAPYRVGQEYVHPGAMACCGPFGAVEYTYTYIIAIAADIRAMTDPMHSRKGVVYAETGVPIALYHVDNCDWRQGTVDLRMIESIVPFNPLDLL